MSIKFGEFQQDGRKAIYINNIKSDEKTSGAQLVREVVEYSFSTHGIDGRISLDAIWGSHFFHMKMGFCPPVDRKVSAEEMYGLTEMMQVENFTNGRTTLKGWVEKVLAVELNRDPKSLTIEDLNLNRHYLVTLLKDKVPAVDSFAYRLANAIVKYKSIYRDGMNTKKLTEFLDRSSNSLPGERMELSEEGRFRWKATIASGGEFKPFRDLSHFFSKIQRPYVRALLVQAMTDLPGFEIPSEIPPPAITKIEVKCKVPFGHTLTIRGQGADLDWGQGKHLQKIDEETYVYCIQDLTQKMEYKLLLDDVQWENCNNREIEPENSQNCIPALSFPKTSVIVNFEAGSNKLYIRGTGPGMSWEKGIELSALNGKYILDFQEYPNDFEFKILLNDHQWSAGKNFKFQNGKAIEISPVF